MATLLGARTWRILTLQVTNVSASVAILADSGATSSESHYQLLLNFIFEDYLDLPYIDRTYIPSYEFHRFPGKQMYSTGHFWLCAESGLFYHLKPVVPLAEEMSNCYPQLYEPKISAVALDCSADESITVCAVGCMDSLRAVRMDACYGGAHACSPRSAVYLFPSAHCSAMRGLILSWQWMKIRARRYSSKSGLLATRTVSSMVRWLRFAIFSRSGAISAGKQ
eukprot:SAG11_NODE_3307_length_2535_cov_2.280788_2_plen_223_part_00